MNPGKRKAPEGTGADARPDQPPESYASPPHEVYMRYTLASRIRWLERYRHWWLKTEDGRAQLEFLERRGAA